MKNFVHQRKGAVLFPAFFFLFLFFIFQGAFPADDAGTNAQPVNRLGHFSIAGKVELNFSRIPNDLRFTAVVGSPYMLNDILSFKGFISQGLFQGVLKSSANSNTQTWSGYTAFGGGLSLGLGEILDIAHPYAELGWMGVIPNSAFTSSAFAWGLYGVVGFDILFNPGDFWGFFIEAGTAGFLSGGIADKVVGDFPYGSGILINLGIRFFL